MSAKSAIQVCIKVRPCEQGQTTLWQVKDKRAIQLIDSQADPCVFDYVFDQDSNNQMVFDCMAKHIVEACMKGFNGTIFAYGQTSSGKTYTMMGDESNPGVMVLAAKEIFKQIARHTDRDFLLRVGYIEIYNEKIYDLLNKKNQDLKIHESNGMVHVNCEECIITSEEDLLQFLCMGNKERTVGETNMNERSSRSHAIFRIIIESRKTDRNDDDAVIQSLLNLVDLAGSERADQTGARGARLKEGGHINKSLHFLSNVIKSLAENEDNKYISFRDSKLTRILQASLGGNAFTSIVCSIKPSIMEESQSTLNFAMRAKKIRLKPQMNEIVSDATMMKRLEREIKELKDRLAEEQRRNESQIKVRLLEQRIKIDTLKIITSNSIADKRNKNRRRTWCPASYNSEPAPGDEISASNINGSTGSNGQHKLSGLPKPSFYPSTTHANHRPFNAPKTINIMKSLDVLEENEFKPAVDYNFGDRPNEMVTSRILPPLTLTPRVAEIAAQSKEMLERDLVELKTFIKLEQNIDSEWECLNEKYAAATAQVDELQSEQLNLMLRCETLQAEVEALSKSNQAADSKIEKYEEQLKTLKQTVEKLEMENRSAVDLEFQYENHKSKSKLRENELLSALSEKDNAIGNLQKTLNELSRDVLRNSKEDQMRSMCPEIETSCESICNKCVDLERLLDEYKKVSPNSERAQSIECECEQLRMEIASTRVQLESVQSAYRQMTSDVAKKSQMCDRLSRDIISVEEAKGFLQERYDDLEVAQQRHDQIIQSMQTEYNTIQEKYQKLQLDYKVLERTTEATKDQYQELQSQNERLQHEISTLKECFEKIQQKLMHTTNSESHETLVQQLKADNEELVNNIAQLKGKYDEMQREYEDLSNQLIESMQDGDSLRSQCSALEEKLKQQHIATISAGDLQSNWDSDQNTQQYLAHIAQLESEITEKNMLIDATEGTINEMREQMTNLESALLEKSVIVNKVEDYQRQIVSLEKQHAEMTMVCEELQEKMKENTINDSQLMSNSTQTLNNDSIQEQEIDVLKVKLSDLHAEVKALQAQIQQKDELIDKIQSELQELNEQCISMDVLQVELQANARQTQQILDRQAAKLADDAERIDKLQESNAQLLEQSIKSEESAAALKQRLEQQIDLECSNEQYEKRLKDLQIALDTARMEFDSMEKQNKDQLDHVKLEYLQKIEVSESGYRENLRKYNIEWEESKDHYETSLNRLQKQLFLTEERCAKLSADSEAELFSVKAANDLAIDQLVKEKHELESLYDESKKLVQQIQCTLSRKEQEDSKDREMVTSSNKKIQELHNKYEMQIREYEQLKVEHQVSLDNLKLEKSSLQSAVDESKLIIECLKSELRVEESDREQEASKLRQLGDALEATIKANASEKADFLAKLEALNSKITDLVEQLKQATLRAKDFDRLLLDHEQSKCLLSEANYLNENLAEKAKILDHELTLAQTELTRQNERVAKLQSDFETTLLLKSNACSEQSNLTNKIQELEAKIFEQGEEKVQFLEKVEMLNSKINDLAEQLKQATLRANDFDKVLVDYEQMKCLLSKANDLNRNLAQKAENLDRELLLAQSELTSQNEKVRKLQSELEETLLLESSANSEQFHLTNKLQEQSNQFEHKLKEVQSSTNDIQLKLESLLSQKLELETVNHQLTVKLKNVLNVQSLLENERHKNSKLEECNSELQSKIGSQEATCNTLREASQQQKIMAAQLADRLAVVAKEADTNICELRSQIDKLQKENENLRSFLKTNKKNFDTERGRLDSTISSLLDDKRNLEEKLCTTNEILKKFEVDLRLKANSSNISFESNASSTSSPAARKSLDREVNQPRKSLSLESEVRRNRRISTHDERRRQSYWNDSRHVACMTDPVDNNCNCSVLDQKLQDCQRELFIMESKVTALNIELKNHPLKEETAKLKKRLQEEQARARDEIKRLKQKNVDLMNKLNAYTVSASISASSQAAITQAHAKQITVETQTESDVETALKKTIDKLNDSLQICRHRYNKIKELEDRLKQNENSDTSNISSQTAGQINALKSQLESQQKDIFNLTKKYDFAKRALKMRRDELDELRHVAATDLATK